MTELPSEWAESNLEDVVDILDSQRVPVNAKERAKRPGDVPYFGATGQVGWIDEPLFDEELLLLGEDGVPFLDAYRPKAYMISGPSWVNNHAHVLRAKAGVTSNRYLMHYLNQYDYHGQVTGTTRLKLTQGAMRPLTVHLAPLPEQRRIVDAIETHLSRIDAGLESLERAQRNIVRMRTAVLGAAVDGRLVPQDPNDEPARRLLERILHERRLAWEAGQMSKFEAKGKIPKSDSWKGKYTDPVEASSAPSLPPGWTTTTWDQVGFSQNGRAFPSKDYSDVGTRLLRPGNLHVSGRVEWAEDNTRALPDTYAEKFPSYIVRGGELVMNLTAQSLRDQFLGRICITGPQETCLLNQRIARLTPILVEHRFMFWMFKSPVFRRFVDGLNKGSLIQHLYTSELAEFEFPLPPLPEQRRIVAAIDRQMSVFDGIEREVAAGRSKSEPLRKSVLAAAFSGRLAAQDSSDEPAPTLPDQVRAERNETTA